MGRYDYLDEMTPAEREDYFLRHKGMAYVMGWRKTGPGDSPWLALAVFIAVVASVVAIILF